MDIGNREKIKENRIPFPSIQFLLLFSILQTANIFFMQRILLSVILLAFIGGFWFVRTIANPVSNDATVHRFVIVEGEGVNAISRNLKREGLIKNSFAFETYVWLKDQERSLIAGVYELRPTMSIRDVTRKLVIGDTVSRERDITILEGWDRRKIGVYLQQEHVASFDEFMDATEGMEGRLFPDTYRIYTDATVRDVVQKMTETFDRKVTQGLVHEIANSKRSLHDILTLASILELEVRSEEEMRMAADLFLRRIKIGMPLQSDATINFLTSAKRPQPTLDDLEVESPYNTYKYRGLPPGPIGNPGLLAIRAALLPLPNQYLFYLTTKDDGHAVFAKTFDDHIRNRNKYLR